MLWNARGLNSSLRLNNIPLHEQVIFFFTRSWVYRHSGWPLSVYYYEWCCYKHLHTSFSVNLCFRVSWVCVPEVELMGILTFWGSANWLSKVAVPVYIPNCGFWDFLLKDCRGQTKFIPENPTVISYSEAFWKLLFGRVVPVCLDFSANTEHLMLHFAFGSRGYIFPLKCRVKTSTA